MTNIDKIKEEIGKKLSIELGVKQEDVEEIWEELYQDDVREGRVTIGRSIDGTAEVIKSITLTGLSVSDILNLKE